MNRELEKKAFTLPSDNIMRYAVAPIAMGLVGSGAGALVAPDDQKWRGALEGGALGVLGGFGIGAGQHLGAKVFPTGDMVERTLHTLPGGMGHFTVEQIGTSLAHALGQGATTTAGGLLGASLGTMAFPGIRERANKYQVRTLKEKLRALEAEQRAKTAAYQFGRRLAYQDAQRAKTATTLSGNWLKNLIAGTLIGSGAGAGVGAWQTPDDRLRGALWGTAMGAGVGAGHALVGSGMERLLGAPQSVLGGVGKGLVTGASQAVGGFAGGLATGIPAYYAIFGDKERDMPKSWRKVSAEQPTRPTHKNPGPVPTDPTSVIESTPKQDTCAVSPKTY